MAMAPNCTGHHSIIVLHHVLPTGQQKHKQIKKQFQFHLIMSLVENIINSTNAQPLSRVILTFWMM